MAEIKLLINDEEKILSSSNLSQLLDDLKINKDKTAIELNGKIITTDKWAETKLESNDRIEIVTFVGGG